MLQILLDSPTGLGDLYRVSRLLFKDSQHLCMVGQAGTSKLEFVQLMGLVNDVVVMEVDAPQFGEPLRFSYAFRQCLLSAVKLFNTALIIVISD